MPKYHISGYLLNLNLAFYTVAFKCGIKSASDLNEKKQKKTKTEPNMKHDYVFLSLRIPISHVEINFSNTIKKKLIAVYIP